MLRKSKKSRKMRGSRYHARGYNDRNRGAGTRGGRGRSGSGKRADQKKTRYINAKLHDGVRPRSFGFSSLNQRFQREVVTMNLVDIERFLDYYLENGIFTQNKDVIVVDLRKLGVDKLLGSGKVMHKFDVTVSLATEKAISKIKAAGGSIAVLDSDEEESVEEE